MKVLPLMSTPKSYKIADLFAGCGGLSLGLEQAGFTPWFVNELVEQYCNTYKVNHHLSDEHYFVGDISLLNQDLDKYKDLLADITLVCGGPPCQGFSSANRQPLIDDPRNHLYKEYLKFLRYVRPKFFIIENVKGMMRRIEDIGNDLKDYLGEEYQYGYKVLNAQDFGVPQNRERFIMIGNRVGVPSKDIFDKIDTFKRPPFLLKDVIDGLPILHPKKEKGGRGIECAESGYTKCQYSYVQNDFYYFINGDRVIPMLYNHKNRYNNERDLEIYRRLPQGANSLHELIADIMPYTRRKYIFKDKYFKLDENKVCKTITSHMRFDCNMYIHPREARGLSPREAARIQTFPDDYILTGPQNSWYAQVGNAVPVKLAKAIGEAIISYLQ